MDRFSGSESLCLVAVVSGEATKVSSVIGADRELQCAPLSIGMEYGVPSAERTLSLR